MLDGPRNNLVAVRLRFSTVLSVIIGKLMDQISDASILHLDLLNFLILVRIITIWTTGVKLTLRLPMIALHRVTLAILSAHRVFLLHLHQHVVFLI
jgi:hypothetical protein